ncbi:MAG: HAMP domain-containing sensor histidine kinase [Clostridia bacterium]|nr:HAMP domain-containing sensor histidine kinase [Clostridia bacterium]
MIIILSFGVGGFVLINVVFNMALDEKINSTCESNSFVTSSFYAMQSNSEDMGYNERYADYLVSSFLKGIAIDKSETNVKIGGAESIDNFGEKSPIAEIKENSRIYRIVQKSENSVFLQVISRLKLSKKNYYIQTVTDISDIYSSREHMLGIYRILIICVALMASLILVFFSHRLTRPLVKLSSITQRMADGDLSIRAETKGTKEIAELSKNYNNMAQSIENYVDKLKESAQSREEFVNNFTHEMKTPLTSIIGYADMLRSYELDVEEKRKCADCIYKEGKRLEALSSSLLSIIVLKNNSVDMSDSDVKFLIDDIKDAVRFLLEKYNISLEIDCTDAKIFAEYSLIKTLICNLIDNACKASQSGSKITLTGAVCNDRFRFTVADMGRGIPANEISKITQPFYMVDKSRARSMGGAGLGLALCSEIAYMHGSQLHIESTPGVGTAVSFDIAISQKKDGDSNA